MLPVLWAEFAGVVFWAAANPIANTPKSVPEIHLFIFSADIALSLNPAQLHHPKGRTFFLKQPAVSFPGKPHPSLPRDLDALPGRFSCRSKSGRFPLKNEPFETTITFQSNLPG